jgi:hypothetical protein
MPVVNVQLGKNVIIAHPDLVNLYGCEKVRPIKRWS